MSTPPRRPLLAVLAAPLLLSLASTGCKSAERTEDEPTPSAAPTASAAPSAPVAEPPPTVAAPRPPVTTPPVLVGRSDGGAPTDAGTPAPAVDAGGGLVSPKLKACVEKCQGVLQTCLTSGLSKDGGLPQPLNAGACQTAFATCQTACTP